MFKRDHHKFQNVIDNLDENPLGSGALAGTSYNIDRNLTTKLLDLRLLQKIQSIPFLIEIML